MWGCEMVRTDAKHLSARKAEKVQMSAAPYRGAPIRTCPAPAAEPVGIRDEGHTVTPEKDGRIFRRHGVEPYTRKDGESTMLLLWRGTCAACGAPFTVKTPQRLEGTKAFGRKHCDMHKLKRGCNEC